MNNNISTFLSYRSNRSGTATDSDYSFFGGGGGIALGGCLVVLLLFVGILFGSASASFSLSIGKELIFEQAKNRCTLRTPL